MNNVKHILCVGEASVHFVAKDKDVYLLQAKHFKKEIAGEALLAMEIAKKGVPTSLLAKVGHDGFGNLIYRQLKQAGVDTSALVFEKNLETSAAFCSYQANGKLLEKHYINVGADLNLQAKDVGLRVLENVSLIHFSTYGLLNESERCLASLLTWAIKKKIAISFALKEDTPINKAQMRALVWQYLAYTNIFFLNKRQLAFLTGLTNREFAISVLYKENSRLEDILLKENETIIYYYCGHEVARRQLSYSEEKTFIANFLIKRENKESLFNRFFNA